MEASAGLSTPDFGSWGCRLESRGGGGGGKSLFKPIQGVIAGPLSCMGFHCTKP